MKTELKIAIVGQGPNQTAWKHGLDLGIRSIAADAMATVRYPDAPARMNAATRYAENYCSRVAITGAIGKRLAELAGYDVKAREELRFYAKHLRLNLNARWNGKDGKGDKFDRVEAERRAKQILAIDGLEKVVLLGAEVGRAFGIRGEWLKHECIWTDKNRPVNFLLFPHPSAINTFWNEEFNRARAARRLREFLNPEWKP